MEKKTVTAEELLEKVATGESIRIVDVREMEKYHTGSVEIKEYQTENMPYVSMKDDLHAMEHQIAALPKDALIVTVCTTGNKAQKAAAILREKGLLAVALEGGLTAWREKSAEQS